MSVAELIASLDQAESLGAKTVKSGARLIGHIPHWAPEGYLHVVFPPLSGPDLDKLRRALKRNIPPEYEALLGTTNGLSVFADSLALYGHRTSYRRSIDDTQPYSILDPNQEERPSGLQSSVLVIGGYSEDGSKVCLDGEHGVVFRCERYRGDLVLNRWPNLETMLQSEIKRLSGLFDERGRRKDGVKTVPSPD